ncbi:hypothetical protein E4T42_09784 [Aureobasidium subglaciale]|nr:hypothetical protein E4T42_09784 [Aureobasidium subglaciale]
MLSTIVSKQRRRRVKGYRFKPHHQFPRSSTLDRTLLRSLKRSRPLNFLARSRPVLYQLTSTTALAGWPSGPHTLTMLFKATEGQLERVVPQTGLRMLIHDHLSKFISTYKDSQLAAPRQLISGGTTLRIISSEAQEISSDSSSSDDSNFDDDLLDDEHHLDTSDGML